MYEVILLRHGQSIWNKKNIFTGWTDVDLSKKGLKQAKLAAKILKRNGLGFDYAFSSLLKKSIRTLWTLCEEMDLCWVKIKKTWRLNERHYGALQGFNKKKMARLVGKRQVFKWRRGYEDTPPKIKKDDPRFPGNDHKYKAMDSKDLPLGESLADVVKRVSPYWEKKIIPKIKKGRKVIVVSHGNCLRALVKYIQDISDEDIEKLNLPCAKPMVYCLGEDFKYINHKIIER